jgi:hypothetical protein
VRPIYEREKEKELVGLTMKFEKAIWIVRASSKTRKEHRAEGIGFAPSPSPLPEGRGMK